MDLRTWSLMPVARHCPTSRWRWAAQNAGCACGASADSCSCPAAAVVAEALPDRGVDLQPFDLLGREKAYLPRFRAEAQLPTKEAAGKADGALLTHLAVRESYHVLRVGVETHDILGLHLQAGLFPHFAPQRLLDALPNLHRPAWQCPQGIVPAPMQQDAAAPIGHDGGGSGDERVRLRCLGVVEVVHPCPDHSASSLTPRYVW